MLEKFAAAFVLASLLVSCAPHVPATDYDVLRPDAVLAVDQTRGPNRLIVEPMGTTPTWLGHKRFKCCGFFLSVYHRGLDEPVFRMASGEIEPACIIDFSDFGRGKISITTTAWDPRTPDLEDIPFEEKIVTIQPDGSLRSSRKLLLEPEAYDAARARKLAAEIRAASHHSHDDAEDESASPSVVRRKLGHLRNMAPGNPDEIAAILSSLPPLPGDCACGHLLMEFLDDVHAIKEIVDGR